MYLYLIYFLSFIFFCFLGFCFEDIFWVFISHEECCYADPSGGLLALGFLVTGLYFLLAIPGFIAIYLRFTEESIDTAKYYVIGVIGLFLLFAFLNGFIWPRHVEPAEIEEYLAGIRFGIIILSNLISLFVVSRISTFLQKS